MEVELKEESPYRLLRESDTGGVQLPAERVLSNRCSIPNTSSRTVSSFTRP